MARKTADTSPAIEDPAPSVPAQKPLQPSDIIPDGDYAGMTYDEVMEVTIAAVNDAYANLSLPGVCAVHDCILGDLMVMVAHYDGPVAAHEAAIRFGQTLMPYLEAPTPINRAYGSLLRLRHEWETDGEF